MMQLNLNQTHVNFATRRVSPVPKLKINLQLLCFGWCGEGNSQLCFDAAGSEVKRCRR